MGKKTVVLDTNVLISALGWGGPPETCLKLLMDDDIENFISSGIKAELSRVMDYPKFEFSEEEKETFLEVVLSESTLVEPCENIQAVDEDSSDNKFLECALDAGADYLVTGDPHLLDMGEFEGIEILKPKTFLEKID